MLKRGATGSACERPPLRKWPRWLLFPCMSNCNPLSHTPLQALPLLPFLTNLSFPPSHLLLK